MVIKKPLLIGYRDEKTFNHFSTYLKKQNIDFDVLDIEHLLDLESRLRFNLAKGNLIAEVNDTEFNFSDYSSFYCRIFLKKQDNTGNKLTLHFDFINLILNYLNSSHKLVINIPQKNNSNNFKLYHIIKLKKYGFNIPYSFISNNSKIVTNEITFDKQWINKGVSGIRTKVAECDEFLFSDIDLVDYAPTQFQKKIVGFNVRVHVVGNKLIPLKIKSSKVDYRYNDATNEYSDIKLPYNIKLLCLKYCNQLKLFFVGFDFIVCSETNKWFVLEVNPMPGYDYYDKKVNFKISEALKETLLNPHQFYKIQDDEIDIKPLIRKNRRTLK